MPILPSSPTDLQITSYVINNLLFLTPERNLLYVTDAFIRKRGVVPSHLSEHLACFFPGLLALGVHLLPLNHLDALGINVTALADDLLPADRRAFADLTKFNLADVHLWAAEGLAQTCYLTYADQPTGLGPETVRMDVHELGAIRWMDAMRAWREAPSEPNGWWRRAPRGEDALPPGVGDIKPWTSPLDTDVTVEELVKPGRRKGKANTFGRDYLIQNRAYYLRPEVRGTRFPCVCVLDMLIVLCLGRADRRIVLYPMANDWRREMAPSWLARLPSHRTLHQDRLGVHKC